MGWVLGLGNGVVFRTGSSQSWSSYWPHQSEVLFFGLYSEISGGHMPNKVDGGATFLTVAGSAGSETYQCPNTAPYIAADTDYIWFQSDGSQRTVTTAELVGYDIQRTPVKYENESPNEIVAIMILSAAVTGVKRDRLFKDMWLPVMWDNSLSIYGYVKDNRGATQQLYVEMSTEYLAVYNAFTSKPLHDDIIIQQEMLNALVDGGYFAKAELLDVFACHGNAESLFDWKTPGGTHNPELVNAPAWEEYKGFTGASTGGKCIRLRFNPSTDCVAATQNSICAIIGIMNDVAESKTDFGAGDGTDGLFIQSRSATDTLLAGCNNGSYEQISNANSKRHIAISREGSTNYDIYVNKVKTTMTKNSSGTVNAELYACAVNDNGSIGASNRTLAYCFVFSGLSDAECNGVVDIMEAYLDNYSNGLI